MALPRYEISLWVLKNIFFNTRGEILHLLAAMQCSIYYINTNEIPNHFTLIVFWCERGDLLCSHSKGDIFTWEDNMLFSQWRYQVFVRKLPWYFIGVYIIKKLIKHEGPQDTPFRSTSSTTHLPHTLYNKQSWFAKCCIALHHRSVR